jgi:hypothetical protein
MVARLVEISTNTKIVTLTHAQFLAWFLNGVIGILHAQLAFLKALLLLSEPNDELLKWLLSTMAVIVLLLRNPNNVLFSIVQFLVNTRHGLIGLIALLPVVVVFAVIAVQSNDLEVTVELNALSLCMSNNNAILKNVLGIVSTTGVNGILPILLIPIWNVLLLVVVVLNNESS